MEEGHVAEERRKGVVGREKERGWGGGGERGGAGSTNLILEELKWQRNEVEDSSSSHPDLRWLIIRERGRG